MSYCTTENTQSARMLDERHAAEDMDETAKQAYYDSFMAACRRGDANAIAHWAPRVVDYSKVTFPTVAGQRMPKRWQTVSEVVFDGVECKNARTETMQLLLNFINADDKTEAEAARSLAALKAQAQCLAHELAVQFSETAE